MDFQYDVIESATFNAAAELQDFYLPIGPYKILLCFMYDCQHCRPDLSRLLRETATARKLRYLILSLLAYSLLTMEPFRTSMPELLRW